MVPSGWEGPQYGKLFYSCFNGKKGRAVRATLVKTIFKCIFKSKIIKKNLQDPPQQMSSNLYRSFLFKCRDEFHIIPKPLVKGWGNNKKNYYCR
jgi:hypothetical protein